MPKVDFVYYPYCGKDSSVFTAFQDSDVLGVDQDPAAVAELQKQGLDARAGRVEDTDLPATPDVLVLLGASGYLGMKKPEPEAEKLAPFVKNGGHIVTNSLVDVGFLAGFYKEIDLVGRVDPEFRVENSPAEGIEAKGEPSTDLEYLQLMIAAGQRRGSEYVATRLRVETEINPKFGVNSPKPNLFVMQRNA